MRGNSIRYIIMKTLSFSVIIMFMAVLGACAKEKAPAVKKPAGEAQKVQKAVEAPAPKAEEKKNEFETYVYDLKGKRDPFLSIIEAAKKEREAEKQKRGLKLSEIFEVADVSVVAIAWDKDRYYAMVQLPDKKYFTVIEGMTLGIYGGKVIRIDPSSVLVREFIKDYKGDIQPKDTVLKLRKEGVE